MSTSRLQRETSHALSIHLGKYIIRENYRPEWLNGMELDFYIEELKTGIEVQGQQHYQWIKYFHKTYSEFQALQSRDQKKKEICDCHQIGLYYIHDTDEMRELLFRLSDIEFVYPLHPKIVKRINQEEAIYLHRKMMKHREVKGLCTRIKRYRREFTEAKRKITKTNLKRAIQKRTDSIRGILTNRGYHKELIDWFVSTI
jgi:hypothetical protein